MTNASPPPALPPIPDYTTAIKVDDLTYCYPSRSSFVKSSTPTILDNLSVSLPKGSRTLLIGANGSGKSTFLRILAGRHLTANDHQVTVCGLNAYRDTKLNFHRAYLDCDWGMKSSSFAGSAPLQADIAVKDMMKVLQNQYPERRDEIVEMLGIDLDWRMHELSDGQRRRVQILLGLVRPFQILLLDEITTSLDVCVRQDLLRWLHKETVERGATIVYATHIFDGLDDWPTDVMYLTDKGVCGWQGKLDDNEFYQELRAKQHPAKMLALADHWLRTELEERRASRKRERACGEHAFKLDPTERQGGYASGRNIDTALKKPEEATVTRQGRLSDAGVLNKHNTEKGNEMN